MDWCPFQGRGAGSTPVPLMLYFMLYVTLLRRNLAFIICNQFILFFYFFLS